jgi:hypothetical protein
MGKSKAVSSHRSPRKKDPESHAETRRRERVGDRVPQLPKTICCSEGVMGCSGLAELGMVRERVDGEIQSGVKPPQSKNQGSGLKLNPAVGLSRRKGLLGRGAGVEG